MPGEEAVLAARTVIVTGAGRGLGRAYALAVAASGANVVVNDIDAAEAASTVDEIRRAGGTAVADSSDVSRDEQAVEMVLAAVRTFGGLAGLVNNAALHDERPSWEVTGETARRLVEVNVLGVINAGLHAMRVMRPAGRGVILNVTSGAALGMRNLALYGATKGAVISATAGWSIDLADSGVRVVGLSPLGRSRMSGETSRAPDPGLVAPVVVYLLSDRAAALHGQVVRFEGSRLGVLTPAGFDGPFVVRDEWDVDAIAAGFDALAPSLPAVGMRQPHRLETH